MRVRAKANQPDIKPLRGVIRTVYKFDPKRSNVWLEADGDRAYVVKRFESSPAKQQFLRCLHIHPGQCEIKQHRKLEQMGIPVVPIQEQDWQAGKLCLITPVMGQSLDRAAQAGAFDQPAARHALAKALGELTALLLSKQLFFRDLKCSNILMDEDGILRLIDAGSIRKVSAAQLPECLKRMTKLLEKTAVEAAGQSPISFAISKTDRFRFARTLLFNLMPNKALTDALEISRSE